MTKRDLCVGEKITGSAIVEEICLLEFILPKRYCRVLPFLENLNSIISVINSLTPNLSSFIYLINDKDISRQITCTVFSLCFSPI